MDFSKVFRKFRKGPGKEEGFELRIRLTPRAAHDKIGGIALDSDGKAYLKVYVTAVPEENKANKALIALLANSFHVPKSSLRIISGQTDRQKIIWFESDISLK